MTIVVGRMEGTGNSCMCHRNRVLWSEVNCIWLIAAESVKMQAAGTGFSETCHELELYNG